MAYAVFRTGGKQYRVSEGDTIDVEKLDVEVGEKATFEDVVLVADGKSTQIGAPVVKGAKITAKVLEQRCAPKVIAFKFKRRKGYHKTKGHRRQLTRLAIEKISS